MPFLCYGEGMGFWMENHLLILGAGQYSFVARETAEAMGCFGRIDCLDDNNPEAIGKLSDYLKLFGEYTHAFVAMGNPALRLEWLEKLEAAGYRLPVLCSPKAYVAPSARVMGGCIMEPMAVVQSNTVIKRGCLICAGSIVNHNAVVEAGCQIDCGAIVRSNTTVPDGTKVSCGAII